MYKKIAAMPKEKKTILIVVVIIAVLAGGLLGYRLYVTAKHSVEDVIDAMFDESSWLIDFRYSDESTYPELLEEFNRVKNKLMFKREIVEVIDEFTEISIHNLTCETDERTENRYYDKLNYVAAHEIFQNVVGWLDYSDYENKKVRDRFTAFYTEVAQTLQDQADSNEKTAESELESAVNLDYLLQRVNSFNAKANDFYKIDLTHVVLLEEVEQHFDQAIQISYGAKNTETFVKAISQATQSPLFEGRAFMDSQQIVDFLMTNDDGAVYTLLNGVGGYYDTHQVEAYGDITCHGDFATRVTTSGGGMYDTSGLGGVWGALTPGQRAEISKGNQSKTYYDYYLCGENFGDNYDRPLEDDAYGYVYLNEDGTCLYFAEQSIFYMSDTNYKSEMIRGDFSKQDDEMEQKFRKEHVAKQPEIDKNKEGHVK